MFLIFRILISCFTAGALVFFSALLVGEDLVSNNDSVSKLRTIQDNINRELNGNIDLRINNLGEIPEKDPFRKFYSIELAKEIHQIHRLIEQQKIVYDAYTADDFQIQLKRVMDLAESSNVALLMDEISKLKEDLKRSADLLKKREDRLILHRNLFLILFFIMWIGFFLYYSRGILFKQRRPLAA